MFRRLFILFALLTFAVSTAQAQFIIRSLVPQRVNPAPGAGEDGYCLTYDHGTTAFVWATCTSLASGSVTTTEILDATIAQVDINDTQTIAADPANGASSVWFGTTGFIFEGATSDGIETLLIAADPTSADKTITLPDETGTLLTDATSAGGDLTGTYPNPTITTNAVALATDTTGNFVATIADAGNSNITVANSGSENAAVTLDVVDVTCTDCLNATEIEDIYVLNTTDSMSGDLTVGDDFFVDVSEGRVGINDLAPVVALDVDSTAETIANFRNSAAAGDEVGVRLAFVNNDGTSHLAGERLVELAFNGVKDGAGNEGTATQIISEATETWTQTNRGANLQFYTQQNGAIASTLALTLDQDQSATFGNNVTIGAGAAATDYTLTVNGETADGVITWMEDEDYFQFQDDVAFADTAGLLYGHMYFDNATPITVTTTDQNTWYEIGDTWTAGEVNGVTFGSSHYLDVGANGAGKYMVSWSAGCSGNFLSSVWEMGIMLDGTIQSQGKTRREQGNADDAASLSGVAILDLAANKQVSLGVRDTTAAAKVVSCYQLNVVITQIGGT